MSQPVTTLSVERSSFPSVTCGACGTQALTWVDVSGEEDVRRCLACDARVADDQLSLVGKRSVEAMGYAFIDRERAGKKRPQSKCEAKGVRSCGSGGCSSGSCGTGGGCSSGGCGSH